MRKTERRVLSLLLALVLCLASLPLCGGTAAAPAPKTGDLDGNGKITTADARLALRAAIGLERLSADACVNADADRNGQITTADARLILRNAVGLQTLEPVWENEILSTAVEGKDRKPYESDDYELIYLSSVKAGGREHVILDDYYTVTVPVAAGAAEEDLLNCVGVVFNDAGEPFFILPDAAARAKGELRFNTLHFSLFGAAKLSDAQLLDLWAERAAAQSEIRRISEEDLTPGLAQMLKDCGLAKDQYAGAIVRSILSLDTRGEILTATMDGDGETLRAKLVNYAGEYFLGKLFKQEEDEFLTQSLGDHAVAVKQAVKDGNYKAALTEIVKNIEKNMFPYVNYADKIASLTDKLADIWTDDMMNEQYEVYKKLGGASVTDDEWNIVYMQLRGAAHRLSSRGVSSADLRKKFEQRAKNEEKIAAAKKELLRDAAEWRRMGLMDTHYWYNSLGDYPSDTERLNSLRQIREMLRAMLTLDGKFQRGKSYMTDKDFLTDALFEWVTNGIKGRENFYKWLRDQGVYLPREENYPAGVDSSWFPMRVTPAEPAYRQHAEYMDLAEAALLESGTKVIYKKNDDRIFDIRLSGEGLTVHMTGKYKYCSWDGASGSCTITWTNEYSVDNFGTPINRRAEYYYTADQISVTDRGEGDVYIMFTGDHDYYMYEEIKGEMKLKGGYPIHKVNLSFNIHFTYDP